MPPLLPPLPFIVILTRYEWSISSGGVPPGHGGEHAHTHTSTWSRQSVSQSRGDTYHVHICSFPSTVLFLLPPWCYYPYQLCCDHVWGGGWIVIVMMSGR